MVQLLSLFQIHVTHGFETSFNFLTALSEKDGSVYSPDGKNVCKLVIKYMNDRNETNWNVNTAGITLTEIKSVDELKRPPDEDDNNGR